MASLADNVAFGTEDACWRWLGPVDSFGYGRIKNAGRWTRTHRVAFLEANGYLPSWGVIRHLCANKVCVNPNHLAHGTAGDNARDAVRAGAYKNVARYRKRNEEHCNAVLTNAEVTEMRAMFCKGVRVIDIVRASGRKYTTVWAAVHGQNFGALTK